MSGVISSMMCCRAAAAAAVGGSAASHQALAGSADPASLLASRTRIESRMKRLKASCGPTAWTPVGGGSEQNSLASRARLVMWLG